MSSEYLKISNDRVVVSLEENKTLVTQYLVGTPCLLVAQDLKVIWSDLIGEDEHYKLCILHQRFSFNKEFKAFKKEIASAKCLHHAVVAPNRQDKMLIDTFLMIQPNLNHVTVFTCSSEAKKWLLQKQTNQAESNAIKTN